MMLTARIRSLPGLPILPRSYGDELSKVLKDPIKKL
jgi:hypothetical protein